MKQFKINGISCKYASTITDSIDIDELQIKITNNSFKSDQYLKSVYEKHAKVTIEINNKIAHGYITGIRFDKNGCIELIYFKVVS